MDVLGIFIQYGWTGIIIAVLVVSFYKFFSSYLSDMIHNFIKMLKRAKQDSLNAHTFFSTCDYILNVEIPALNIYTKNEAIQNITKEILFAVVLSVQECGKKIISVDHDSINKKQWITKINNIMISMDATVISKLALSDVPQPVYLKFLEWYLEKKMHLRHVIEKLYNSELYPSVHSKSSTILLLMEMFCITILADIQIIIDDIFDKIDCIKYKNSFICLNSQNNCCDNDKIRD